MVDSFFNEFTCMNGELSDDGTFFEPGVIESDGVVVACESDIAGIIDNYIDTSSESIRFSWDSVSDDYDIYQDGTLIESSVNDFVIADNLSSDTQYSFSFAKAGETIKSPSFVLSTLPIQTTVQQRQVILLSIT